MCSFVWTSSPVNMRICDPNTWTRTDLQQVQLSAHPTKPDHKVIMLSRSTIGNWEAEDNHQDRFQTLLG